MSVLIAIAACTVFPFCAPVTLSAECIGSHFCTLPSRQEEGETLIRLMRRKYVTTEDCERAKAVVEDLWEPAWGQLACVYQMNDIFKAMPKAQSPAQ